MTKIEKTQWTIQIFLWMTLVAIVSLVFLAGDGDKEDCQNQNIPVIELVAFEQDVDFSKEGEVTIKTVVVDEVKFETADIFIYFLVPTRIGILSFAPPDQSAYDVVTNLSQGDVIKFKMTKKAYEKDLENHPYFKLISIDNLVVNERR